MDHLSQTENNPKTNRKHSSREDEQNLHSDQTIQCEIHGKGDMVADSRRSLFHLMNSKTMLCAFNQHIL